MEAWARLQRLKNYVGNEVFVRAEHHLRYSLRSALVEEDLTPRVFCIGDIRTGTLSLTKSLQILGIPTIHRPYSNNEPREGWIQWIREAPWQGFTDHPFSDYLFFKELDEAFPDARFILTTREEDVWKESVFEHERYTAKRYSWEDVERLNEKRLEHEEAAREYFDDSLLVLPLEAEDKWERLCSFLDKEVPDRPYPHLNRRENFVKTAFHYYLE